MLGVTAGCGLPVHETTNAVEFSDGVDTGNKLIYVRELPDYLDLKILLRLGNVNSIILGKALEEMHTLKSMLGNRLSFRQGKQEFPSGL